MIARRKDEGGHADLLADSAEHRQVIRGQAAEIRYLVYDWSLNDANR